MLEAFFIVSFSLSPVCACEADTFYIKKIWAVRTYL